MSSRFRALCVPSSRKEFYFVLDFVLWITAKTLYGSESTKIELFCISHCKNDCSIHSNNFISSFLLLFCRWEEEKHDDGVKWTYLEHKGPMFAPPYEPLPKNVKFFYSG